MYKEEWIILLKPQMEPKSRKFWRKEKPNTLLSSPFLFWEVQAKLQSSKIKLSKVPIKNKSSMNKA